MGIDIMFYIQKKVGNKWENIELFNKDKRVEIWRSGRDTWEIIKDTWNHSGMTDEDIVKLALEVDLGAFEDFKDIPPNCWISLTKLELFQYLNKFNNVDIKEETKVTKKFYKALYEEVQYYIGFAEDGIYGYSDNIRIVAFAC